MIERIVVQDYCCIYRELKLIIITAQIFSDEQSLKKEAQR
jgi:hypothetical protein